MSVISREEQEKITEVLTERGALEPCPRCGHDEFAMADGYGQYFLQSEIGKTIIGGRAIPFVAAICTHCGYISQHALGVLGLLPRSKKEGGQE